MAIRNAILGGEDWDEDGLNGNLDYSDLNDTFDEIADLVDAGN